MELQFLGTFRASEEFALFMHSAKSNQVLLLYLGTVYSKQQKRKGM